MSQHVTFLLLGLGNGAVFAALAMALVVTYRSSGVLNFAAAPIALHAAYTYAFFRRGELMIPLPVFSHTVALAGPLGFVPALAATLVIEALLGMVLYLIVFRPLRSAVPLARAIASLGVMLALTAALARTVGTAPIAVDPIFSKSTLTLGEIRVPADRLYLAGTIVIVAVVLGLVFRFTRFGLLTRATAETETGSLVSGISPDRVLLGNWALSTAVAALAGILIAPIVPLVPFAYLLFIVPALAAAVLGHLELLAPAVIGGLAIGCLQSEAVYLQSRYDWLPQAGIAELIPLLLIVIVFARRSGSLPGRGAALDRSVGRAARPRRLVVSTVTGTVVAGAALLVLHGSYRAAFTTSLIMAVIALSLVVVSGYGGQISLAQLTIAGVAGFILSPITTHWGIPFPIAPLLAAAFAAVVGTAIGFPALRIRGLPLAVVTLSMAVAVEAIWFRNEGLNGGLNGLHLKPPRLPGIDLSVGTGASYPRPQFGFLCLVTLTAVAIGVALLRRSRLGLAMLAVKNNELSAAAAGISVVRVKLVGFALGAFVAGIGGSLLAYQQTTVTWESFSTILGLSVFAVAFVGGISSIRGAVIAGLLAAGGIVFVLIDRTTDLGGWYDSAVGVAVVLAVIFRPEGLAGLLPSSLTRDRAEAPARPPSDLAPRIDMSRRSSLPHLTVRDLWVRYGGVTALAGVNIEVFGGTIVGVIGPNGAGKTSLIDAINGFAPAQGSITLAGVDLSQLSPHRRALAGLGRTFQGPDLCDDLTVLENVLAGDVGKRRDHATASQVAVGLLHRFGLELDADALVSTLSMGRRRLVSIARSLAARPTVLMLDEPAAGLDTTESRWLAQRLQAVRDDGTAILLVDHDIDLVFDICDRVIVIDLGQIIATGTPAEIRAHPNVVSAYLGSSADL